MTTSTTKKPVKTRKEIQSETITKIQMQAKRILDTELSTLTAKHGPCPPALLRELYATVIFAVVFAWPDRPAGLRPHSSLGNIRQAFDQWTGVA